MRLLQGQVLPTCHSPVVLYLTPLKYSGHGLSTRAPAALRGQHVPIWSKVLLQNAGPGARGEPGVKGAGALGEEAGEEAQGKKTLPTGRVRGGPPAVQ